MATREEVLRKLEWQAAAREWRRKAREWRMKYAKMALRDLETAEEGEK